jgi:hypothetical protein
VGSLLPISRPLTRPFLKPQTRVLPAPFWRVIPPSRAKSLHWKRLERWLMQPPDVQSRMRRRLLDSLAPEKAARLGWSAKGRKNRAKR